MEFTLRREGNTELSSSAPSFIHLTNSESFRGNTGRNPSISNKKDGHYENVDASRA